jgi:hypothetical protein
MTTCTTGQQKVLVACCLRPNLEQLGEAGDLAAISERGFTLSGGRHISLGVIHGCLCLTKTVLTFIYFA